MEPSWSLARKHVPKVPLLDLRMLESVWGVPGSPQECVLVLTTEEIDGDQSIEISCIVSLILLFPDSDLAIVLSKSLISDSSYIVERWSTS